ncbi:MAG: Mut7-C RNAse domain-containing protein [Fervidicoccaceae archaeon]
MSADPKKSYHLKFAVDAMLGNLARYLRMLGYDTVYSTNLEDAQLLELCQAEGRILVTGDRVLAATARRMDCKVLLLEPEDSARLPRALGKVAEAFSLRLKIDPEHSRCPLCNSVLRRADIDEVKAAGLTPGKGALKCDNCGNIYWAGGHWRTIKAVLEEAERLQRTPERDH